jgi:D-glycero-D-manno-heptose 1,7-bisphosphate phosphatase
MSLKTNKTWSLFLDRDGVINQKLPDDYVKNYEEFILMPNVREVLALLREEFKYLFVVTNQQGVGKGIMTESELMKIHWQMEMEMGAALVQFDKIYYCPDLASANSPNRKPNIGMALQAQQDFNGVHFEKSLIIGDSVSDMEFGRKAGMKTIFFGQTPPPASAMHLIDYTAKDWLAIRELLLGF